MKFVMDGIELEIPPESRSLKVDEYDQKLAFYMPAAPGFVESVLVEKLVEDQGILWRHIIACVGYAEWMSADPIKYTWSECAKQASAWATWGRMKKSHFFRSPS